MNFYILFLSSSQLLALADLIGWNRQMNTLRLHDKHRAGYSKQVDARTLEEMKVQVRINRRKNRKNKRHNPAHPRNISHAAYNLVF